MKNKKIVKILSLLLILCLLVTMSSCGKSNDEENTDPEINKEQVVDIEEGKNTKSEDTEVKEEIKTDSQKKETGEKVKPKEQKPKSELSSKAKEYADFVALSADDQYAYYKTFKDADQFMKWYNEVKKAYEKENPTVVINPGDVIDFGELEED